MEFRKITPDEMADFLNAKGATMETFKCPVCHSVSHSITDCVDFQSDEKLEQNLVIQPVIPSITLPSMDTLRAMIDDGKLKSNVYKNLLEPMIAMSVEHSVATPVIHLVCDNCGYVRTFDKGTVLKWLKNKK